MGSPVSPIVAYLFMEEVNKRALLSKLEHRQVMGSGMWMTSGRKLNLRM